jgi:hypothetical protein
MKSKEHITHLLAILICIIIFAILPLKYTVPVNLQNADNTHEELTAFSLNVVNNWLIDGIINDKFVMYTEYASVEFENNNNRNVYLSYPPGALIPLYLTAKVSGKNEISIGFIKRFVQFEYYLSIILLSLLFYICLRLIEVKSRWLILSLPVMFSSLWAVLPYNVYYMNNVYFTDQAVILLSIIFFLIEIAFYGKQFKNNETLLNILSCIVLFAGLLTDYYFFCIASVAVFLRLLNNFRDHQKESLFVKLLHNTWPLILTTVMASALFVIQLISVPDGLKLLALTFSERSSSGTEWGGMAILARHLGNGFTVLFIPVLILVTIFCLIFPFIRKKYSEKKQNIINWLTLIVLSSVLHTIILREHSIIHEFSMLKYNLVFVFTMFTLTCWLYINYFNSCEDRKRRLWKILFHCSIGLVIILILTLQIYNRNFYSIRMSTADHSIARFIRANTNYYDVVYSPDYEINWNPPQDLAISKKRVYKISSLEEIPHNNLPVTAVINILISRDSLGNGNWNKLMRQKNYLTKSDHLYFFKIPGKSFQSVVN